MDTTLKLQQEKCSGSMRNYLAAVAPQHQLSNAASPSPTLIENLPEEMLVKILSFFNVQQLENTVSPVCQLWHDLSQRASLRLQLSLEGVRSEDGTVSSSSLSPSDTAAACKLLSSCPKLRDLSIADRNDVDLLLRHVAMHNHELRRLSVKRCTVSTAEPFLAAQVINNLLLRCPRLVDLTIKRTACQRNVPFSDIVAKLPELRKINLNFSFSIDSMALRMMALHCRKLEEIRLLWKRNPMYGIKDDDVVLLAQCLHESLSVLKIDSVTLSEAGVTALAQCCHLHTLYVRHAHYMTDHGVSQLSRLRNLQNLNLEGMKRVSSDGWVQLFSGSHWSQMKKLSLSGCYKVNNDTLKEVARGCPNLVKLNIAECVDVAREGLSYVCQSCRNLENLNISYTHPFIFSNFDLIPSYIPHLKKLLYYSYSQEDEYEALLFLSNTLPELDIINVHQSGDDLFQDYDY